MGRAAEIVKNLTMHKLALPMHAVDDSGTTDPIEALPFAPVDFEEEGPMKKLVHFVDIISEHRDDFDRDAILENFRRKTFHNLPMPFRLKEEPPCDYIMQLFVVPRNDGAKYVIKHYVMKDRINVHLLKDICVGQAHKVVWGAHEKSAKKALQHLLMHLPGFKVRYFTFDHRDLKMQKELMEESKIDQGFDYIEEHARIVPRKSHLRWVTKELNNEESIIFGWKEALVKEIMQNVANERVLCQEQTVCPVTLRNIKRSFLIGVLKPMIKTMDKKALMMIGEPGIGKTFVGRSVGLALARRWARKIGGERVAMLKSTTEFDFLRGQPGEKSCAWVYDDGALHEQRVRAIKSFADVGDDESMIWARWGATKCVQGQPRLIMDNTFNPATLLPTVGSFPTISHKDFLAAVSPTFPPGTTDANLMACLKRSHLTLNFTASDGTVYVLHRLASEGTEPVPCVVLDESNFINSDGRRRIGSWKDGNRQFGTDYDQDVLWEQNWLARLLEDDEVPQGADDSAAEEGAGAAAEPQPFGQLRLGGHLGQLIRGRIRGSGGRARRGRGTCSRGCPARRACSRALRGSGRRRDGFLIQSTTPCYTQKRWLK